MSDDIKAAFNAVDVIKNRKDYVYVGGSATTLRMLIPIIAALKLKVTLDGDESLKRRPLNAILKALKNSKFTSDRLPLTIEGKGLEEETEIEGWESSQYISGLIYAYHLAGGGRIKIIPPISSKSYILMTIDLFNRFGSDVKLEGNTIYVTPKKLHEYEGEIPGDYALASFYAIGSIISGSKIQIYNLYDLPNYYGDHEIVDILSKMGIKSYFTNNIWIVESQEGSSGISPIEIDINDIPDLAIGIAAIASIAKGKSRLVNVERLRIKESDRIASIIDTLEAFGVKAEYSNNSIIIQGSQIKRGKIVCPNDHRIAMMAADLSLKEGGEVDNAECVNKSNPKFWEDLISLGAQISLK